MADIEVALTTKLGTIGRVYPLILPELPVLPAIVYQRISTVRNRTHNAVNFDAIRFQFSIYGKDYAACRSLSQSLNTLLDVKGDTDIVFSFINNQFDGLDPESGLYRITSEYFVWN